MEENAKFVEDLIPYLNGPRAWVNAGKKRKFAKLVAKSRILVRLVYWILNMVHLNVSRSFLISLLGIHTKDRDDILGTHNSIPMSDVNSQVYVRKMEAQVY